MRRAILIVGLLFGGSASFVQAASIATTTVPTGRVAFVRAVGRGRSGHALVALEVGGGTQRRLELWSMPDGRRVRTLARSRHTLAAVRLGPDGRGGSLGAWLNQDRVGRQVSVWTGGTPRRLTETKGFSTSLEFASSADGHAVVAWSKQGGLWAAFRAPGGSFGRPQLVASSPGTTASMVSIAPGGAAAMTWAVAGHILIARRPPAGSFGPPADLTLPGPAPPGDFISPGPPVVAITHDGRVVTAWEETERRSAPGSDITTTRVEAVDWAAHDPQPGPRRELTGPRGPMVVSGPEIVAMGRSVLLEWPSSDGVRRPASAITSVLWPPSGPRSPVRYLPPGALSPVPELALVAGASGTASLFIETRAAGWWVAPSRSAGGFGSARLVTPRGQFVLGLSATGDGGPAAAWNAQLGRSTRSIRALVRRLR